MNSSLTTAAQTGHVKDGQEGMGVMVETGNPDRPVEMGGMAEMASMAQREEWGFLVHLVLEGHPALEDLLD